MRTILVLAGGGISDESVFKTALDAAQAVGAHLDFLHIHVSAGEAAAYVPHVDYAMGRALTSAMDHLRDEADTRSAAGFKRFNQMCRLHGIEQLDRPQGARWVSAAWRVEEGDALNRMIRASRHNDLVVAARPSGPNGLPQDYLERLILESGRPVLIAPTAMREKVTGTAMVCWGEGSAAARALGAALPLLQRSRRVMLVGAEERNGQTPEELRDAVRLLAWHGIAAEALWVPRDGRSVAERLEATATQYDADLVVMGAYGHGWVREQVFGGCTQRFLDFAGDRALLVMH